MSRVRRDTIPLESVEALLASLFVELHGGLLFEPTRLHMNRIESLARQ